MSGRGGHGKAHSGGKKPLIVFFAPRYHSNQNGWVTALQDAGYRIEFWVFYEAPEYVEPLCKVRKIAPSVGSRVRFLIKRILNREAPHEDVARSAFIPSLPELLYFLLRRKPGLLVLRDRTRPSLITALVAQLAGIPRILFYDQFAADNPNGNQAGASRVGRWLQKHLRLSDIPSITPIPPTNFFHHPAVEQRALPPGRFFVPFVLQTSPPRAPESYCPEGILRVLVVAKYRAYKNLDLVPQALRALDREQLQRLEVTFVGQERTSSEQNFREALESRLEEIEELRRYRVLSNVPHQEMASFYGQADVSVLPSVHDLAAIAPLESLAHGVPPIVTRGNGTSPYIVDKITGFCLETSHFRELSDVLSSLLKSPGTLARMGGRGFEFCREHLSPERITTLAAVKNIK